MAAMDNDQPSNDSVVTKIDALNAIIHALKAFTKDEQCQIIGSTLRFYGLDVDDVA